MDSFRGYSTFKETRNRCMNIAPASSMEHYPSVKKTNFFKLHRLDYYSGNLVDCGPSKRLCIPTRYLAMELEQEQKLLSIGLPPSSTHDNDHPHNLTNSRERLDPLKSLGDTLVQDEIFSKLACADLGKCLGVSKGWKNCTVNDSVWKQRCANFNQGQVFPWSCYYVMFKILVRDIRQDCRVYERSA